MPADRKLLSALRWTAQDRREIAEAIYATKVTTYIDTLADLALGYGYELPEGALRLAPDVDRGLKENATLQARRIVDTYNRELRGFLERNHGRPEVEVVDDYRAWMEDRSEHKSDEVAVQEAYSAYADAVAAFFVANDMDPLFEFGGHPEEGDEPPECDVCQALEATNPHPLSRVLEVGTPHIGCRQKWHALVEPDDLPEELVLPSSLAGIVGADPLNMRLGGDVAAADFITTAGE